MSYAVRNTIILLVTLALFVGSAFGYIKFVQEAELEQLQGEYNKKQQEYNEKSSISDAYPALNDRYTRASEIINNFDKSLFAHPDPEEVYDYLDYISNSSGSNIYFDYVFVDSTAHDQYGIMSSDINGYGTYAAFVNFVNKLEHSQLLNKISGLTISPVGGNEDQELDEVSFTFTLDSYYERIPIQEQMTYTGGLTLNSQISTFNPFYPLILPSVPPNEQNLINIEQSRLIGIAGSRVFLVDQEGMVQSLSEGDEVYLGELTEIDLDKEAATFKLNKGGIEELVTLEIER